MIWLFSQVFNGSLALIPSAPLAIVSLSLFVTLLMMPFQKLVDWIKAKNAQKKAAMKAVEDEITRCYDGEVRFLYLRTLYRQHGYNPLNNFVPLIIPLLQIPFFLAAYEFLSAQKIFLGLSFAGIHDLAMPDAMLMLGGAKFNLLPFLMLLVNLLNVEFTPADKPEDKRTLRLMGVAFFVILYMMPAALVLYWTINNLFQLAVTLLKSGTKEFSSQGPARPHKQDVGLACVAVLVYLVVQWINHPTRGSEAEFFYKVSFAAILILGLATLLLSDRSVRKTPRAIGWAHVFMLGALPVVHYAYGNLVFLDNRFLWQILIYLILPLCLVSIVAVKSVERWGKDKWVLALTAALVLSFGLTPLWLYYVKARIEDAFFYQLLLVLIVFFFLKVFIEKNPRLLTTIHTLLFIFTFGRFSVRYIKREISFLTVQKTIDLPEYLPKASRPNPPDVYFLIYDAYIDEEVSRHFGIDNRSQYQYLREQGFKIYDQKLSLERDSLSSVSATYMLGKKLRPKEQRMAMVGHNIADYWFKSMGYDIYYVADDYFFKDQKFGARSNVVVPSNSVNVLLEGILQGEFKFETITKGFDYERWKELKRSQIARSGKPKLLYAHSPYPKHTQNSGTCLPNEVELFKERLEKGNQEMREDIELILRQNPNSIIITAGDHGVYFTGDCTGMGAYSKDQISGEHILDRFGVHIAIRWPNQNPESYDNFVYLQGVLAAAISYVGQDRAPLLNEVKRDICLRGTCASAERPISDGPDKGKMLFEVLRPKVL
jgi:YidC/Oxa1 family membrane protein insertase